MPEIKCTVNACYFWKQNNLCGAPAIEVAPSHGAKSAFSDAGSIGSTHGASVQRSAETQCLTFRPRGRS